MRSKIINSNYLLATTEMIAAAVALNLSMAYLRLSATQLDGKSAAGLPILVSLFKYLAISVLMVVPALRQLPRLSLSWAFFGLAFGVLDVVASIFLIVASLSVPLALTSILGDLHILFTPLVLFFFKLKNVSLKQLVLSGVGFAGAMLFAAPQFAASSKVQWTVTLPVASASLWCLCGLLSGRMSKFPAYLKHFLVSVSGLLVCAAYFCFAGQKNHFELPVARGYFALSVLFAVIAQLAFIASFTSGEILAALIAAPAYAVAGGICGYLYFSENFGPYEWTGFSLVVFSILVFQWTPLSGTKNTTPPPRPPNLC